MYEQRPSPVPLQSSATTVETVMRQPNVDRHELAPRLWHRPDVIVHIGLADAARQFE